MDAAMDWIYSNGSNRDERFDQSNYAHQWTLLGCTRSPVLRAPAMEADDFGPGPVLLLLSSSSSSFSSSPSSSKTENNLIFSLLYVHDFALHRQPYMYFVMDILISRNQFGSISHIGISFVYCFALFGSSKICEDMLTASGECRCFEILAV